MHALIGVPFLSAILFVFGGMLIGHLLWYRPKTAGEDGQPDTRYLQARGTARKRRQQWIEARKQLDRATEENAQMDARVHQSLADARAAQQKAERAEAAAGEARDEAIAIRRQLQQTELAAGKERQKTEDALGQAHATTERTGRELQSVQDTVQSLRAGLKTTAAQRDEAIAGQQTLRDRIAELETQIDSLQSRLDAFSSDEDDTREQLEVLHRHIEAAELARDHAVAQRNSAIAQRDQFADERDAVKLQGEDVVGQIAALTQLRDRLESQIDEQNATIQALTAEVAGFEQRNQSDATERQAALKIAQTELTGARGRVVELTEELTACRAELAGTDQEKEQLQSAWNHQVEDWSQQKQHLENRAATAMTQVDALTQQNEELNQKRVQSETNAEQLTRMRDELQGELRTQRKEFERQLGEAGNDFSASKQALEKVLLERDEVSKQLAEKTACLEKEIADRVAAETEVETQRQQVESVTAQSGADEQKHRQELDAAQKRIDQLTGDVARLDAELTDRQGTIETLTAKHTQSVDQLQRMHAVGDKLRAAQKESAARQRTIEGNRGQLAAMQQQIQELQDSLADSARTIQNHQHAAAELKNQSAGLREQLAQSGEKLTLTGQQLTRQEAESQAHAAEAQTLRQQIAEGQTLREGLIGQINELTMAGAAGDKAAASLKDQLSTLRGEHTAVTARLKRAEAFAPEAESLRRKLDELTDRYETVMTELNDSLDANAAMQNRMQILETQLHENAEMMRDLRRKRAHVPVAEPIRRAA